MTYDPLNPDNDPFGPPTIPTIVHCIHCNEEYDSYRIVWRVETCSDGKQHGFWCCPIEGCDGRGFGFDIFPVDPEYRDERTGELMWISDDDDDEDEDSEYGEEFGLDDNSTSLNDEVSPEINFTDRDDDIPF
jgi:hypothetical protein